MELVESIVVAAALWLKLLLEVVAAVLVGIGGLTAVGRLLRALPAAGQVRFTPVRLAFARYLSLALEFQLAADIVGTSVAPSWEQLGKLGVVAVIRTALNHFLGREMREERETLAGEAAVEQDAVEQRPAAAVAGAL